MTRRGKAVIGMAIGTVVVVGFLFWLSAVGGLMSRIMPSNNAVSTSMKPYTIELRSRRGPEGRIPDGEPPTEWILTVPRAFVVNEIGHPGVVQNGSKEGTNYFVSIHTVFDEPPRTLSSAVLAKESEVRDRFLGIIVSNNGTRPEITSEDLCMTIDDFNALMDARGGTRATAGRHCTSLPRCGILTHFHGWGLELTLPQKSELYKHPQDACALAKSFLDQHTVKVDDLVKTGKAKQ